MTAQLGNNNENKEKHFDNETENTKEQKYF